MNTLDDRMKNHALMVLAILAFFLLVMVFLADGKYHAKGVENRHLNYQIQRLLPRAGECYGSFAGGIIEVESNEPSVIERGRGRLAATLDLCFPADILNTSAARPSTWVSQITQHSAPDQILHITAILRDGWRVSVIGEPWKGPLP